MTDLRGKRVLVTGGASGIGRETVRLLAARGAIVVVADIDGAGAEELAAEVGGRSAPLDVADPEAWRGFVAEVGPLDFAVLNAGILTGESRLERLRDDAYDRALAVNVGGVVHGVRALAPLLAGRGGAIAVTASLAGLIGWEVDPVYSLTKHAIVGFVRSVAPQLAASGVRINLVCPGITDTALIPDGMREALAEANFPTLTPDLVAAALLQALLLEDTGQALAVQPGREPVRFRFASVPGPIVEGGASVRPPEELRG
ncbi:MAG: SDR family NAD(P)-dependent oxidoreductase [Sporichthyaceae bacterium]